MAPTPLRSRASKPAPSTRAGRTTFPSSLPSTNSHLPSTSSDTLSTTKRDKRQIKHSILLSRLRASHPSSTSNKVQKKRQKAKESKAKREKLSAKLEDLAGALPDLEEEEGTKKVVKSSSQVGKGRELLMRSLACKPGHGKRLKKLKEAEGERFRANLGIMNAGQGGAKSGDAMNGLEKEKLADAQAERWAALRRHIAAQQLVQS